MELDKTYKPPQNYQVKYESKPREVISYIFPICIRYICEHCNDGEMKVDTVADGAMVQVMEGMYPHTCTKCKNTLQLPKIYPYIEWEHSGDIGCPY